MLSIRYLALTSAAIAVAIASFVMPRTANAGGGCHEDTTTEARATTVALRRNCFAATVTRVDEGATVTFTNEDEIAHNVTGAGYTWGGEKTLHLGDSVQHTFDENGVYVYSCLLHPGMVGAIVVGDGSGRGLAAATIVGDGEPRSVSGVGNAGARAAGSAPASDAAASDGGAGSIVITVAMISGVALLMAIAGGSMALARSSASRRASVR
jgi:plastocyanin